MGLAALTAWFREVAVKPELRAVFGTPTDCFVFVVEVEAEVEEVGVGEEDGAGLVRACGADTARPV